MSYVAGLLNVTPMALTITANNQSKVYGGAADADGQLHRVCQWRQLRQPDDSTYGDDGGHRRQPCLGQSLHDNGQRRGGFRLRNRLCGRYADRQPASLTITPHNQTGLRRGVADTHRVVHGLRQWRHLRQSDDPAHAGHERHRRQSCLGKPLLDHRVGSGRQRLLHQLCDRQPDRHSRGIDRHRRQPDQGVRRDIANAPCVVLGVCQWRHLRQPDHSANGDDDGYRQQPCLGQSLRHHRQRRGGFRLLDHLCRGNPYVTPVALTITANNQAKVYGAAVPTLTASYAGFVNGDTAASLTTLPTLRPPPPPAAKSRATRTRSRPREQPTPTTRSAM